MHARDLAVPLWRYGVALAAVAVSLAGFFALKSVLTDVPVNIFLLPLAIAAWFGGLGPGLLATILCTLAVDYFIVPPPGGFGASDPADILRLAIFFGFGVLVSCLFEGMRRTRDRSIADRARLEEVAREHALATQRYEHVVEATNDVIWDWDLEQDQVRYNDNIRSMFGYGNGEVEASSRWWEDALHPDDRERVVASINAAIEAGGTWTCEYRMRRTDGSYAEVYDRGRVLADEAGRATRMVGSMVDVTDRRRTERALIEADRRKDEFLAVLAHELRNPLAPIRTGVQIMRLARKDPATVDRALAMMERQLHQIVRLVDDLLDVSRITRGTIELRRERVTLADIVQAALETSRPVIEQHGHQLAVSLPEEPIPIDADLTRLAQVFANLLNNSAKYTERGGHIVLTASVSGNRVHVRVADDGVGIPKDMLEKIFHMFTQVDRTLDRSQGGLGIGLTIAHRLVEMHGGTLSASSDGPGTGTTMEVVLPLADASSEALPAEVVAAPPHRTGLRILIADDNRDAAASLAAMLNLLGHEALAVYDGEEALEAADQWRPDAILLDIGMPGLNGYDAARAIRAEPWGAKTKLVAVTGWGQLEDRRRSQQAGFDYHLVKPVEPSMVERVLDLR